MTKRVVLKVINLVALIAAGAFWLTPLRTLTQIVLCLGSLVIVGIRGAVSKSIESNASG
jgi:hypothetical protein